MEAEEMITRQFRDNFFKNYELAEVRTKQFRETPFQNQSCRDENKAIL